jgi:hypothetical protein
MTITRLSEHLIRFGNKIKYIKIALGNFDRDTLSFPLASLSSLPYSDDKWTIAYISRDAESGGMRTSDSERQLAGVQNM